MYNYTENRYSLDPPPFLQSEYKPASHRFQQQLPLPGQSVKIPYKQQPTRFLNLNRKKYEIDYLREQIEHKVKMEELHYQARIEQMRRENQINRYRLQEMLREHPQKNLFASPREIADEGKTIGSNLSNLTFNEIVNKKNAVFEDSIDKIKRNKKRQISRVTRSVMDQNDSDSSNDTEERYRKKIKHQEELDYIYKKKQNPKSERGKTVKNFSVDLRKKQDPQQVLEQKKKEYDWIMKVRKAKGNPVFVVKEVISEDSSSSSSSSSSSKSKTKKSLKSKATTSKKNIFSRKNDSESDAQSALRPKPHLRSPRMARNSANPQSSYQVKKQRQVGRYDPTQRSSMNSSSMDQSNWRR